MKRKKIYEITITGEHLSRLMSAKNPTIIIHNVKPDSYVEIFHDLSETEKAMLGRFVEEKSFHKEGRV